jgi:hypothetical protein
LAGVDVSHGSLATFGSESESSVAPFFSHGKLATFGLLSEESEASALVFFSQGNDATVVFSGAGFGGSAFFAGAGAVISHGSFATLSESESDKYPIVDLFSVRYYSPLLLLEMEWK